MYTVFLIATMFVIDINAVVETTKQSQSLVAPCKHLVINETSIRKEGGETKTKSVKMTEYKHNITSLGGIIQETNISPRTSSSIVGINESYKFKLRRRSPEEPWYLTEMLGLPKDTSLEQPILMYGTNKEFPWCGYGSGISVGMLSNKNYICSNVKTENIGDLVKISLDVSFNKSNIGTYLSHVIPIKKCSMIVNPKMHYRIEEYEITRSWERGGIGITHGMKAYDKSNHLKLLLEMTETKYLDSSTTVITHFDFQYKDDPKNEEFYLSNYGLSEPEGVLSNNNNSLYVLITALSILLLIQLAIINKRRREKE